MKLTEKQLLDKKAEIEKNKEIHTRLQTEYRTLLKQLKEEYGFASLAEAKEALLSQEKELEALDAEIEEKSQTIYDTYFQEDADE